MSSTCIYIYSTTTILDYLTCVQIYIICEFVCVKQNAIFLGFWQKFISQIFISLKHAITLYFRLVVTALEWSVIEKTLRTQEHMQGGATRILKPSFDEPLTNVTVNKWVLLISRIVHFSTYIWIWVCLLEYLMHV